VRLAELDCLWQLPDPKQLVHWSRAVADLDGDGLDDLLVPSARGYHLLLQRRDAVSSRFEARFCPLLSPLPLAEGQAPLRVTSASADSRLEVRLSGALGIRTLVAVDDEVPAPFLLDADGDKRLDLLVQDETQLQWFPGSAAGPGTAAESLPSPVVVDERRALDVSFASLLGDINGDGRLDWVLLAGDQRASKARTQILVHHQRVPTREQPQRFVSTPDAVLVIDGFAGDPRLYDLNADGRLDLSLAALRPDLLQALTQGSLDRYELEQYVYLNEGGKLQRRPMLAERLSFRSEESLPTLEFVRDRSGDRVADLLWRPEAGKLRLSMVMTRGERWSLNSTPLFELGIDARARISADSVVGRGAMAPPLDHLLVIGPRDVQVLEF
jgi:FG-GAP-like repeat